MRGILILTPINLNNLPNDYGEQQVFHEGTSSPSTSSNGGGDRKRRNNGRDESEKVYECRFCSLKFYKSQALGGHMNRHRLEKETETLNRARQLVFSNDNLLALGIPHISFQPIYDPAAAATTRNPTLSSRLMIYAAAASSTILPPTPLQHQPYLFHQPPPPPPYANHNHSAPMTRGRPSDGSWPLGRGATVMMTSLLNRF